MPIDASIPLEAGNIQGGNPQQLMSMFQFAHQVKEWQRQESGRNALTKILSDPNSVDQSGVPTPTAVRQIMAVDPDAGMKLQDQVLETQVKRAQEQHYQTEQGKAKFDFLSGLAGIGYDAYSEAKKAGRSEADAVTAATLARNEAAKNNGGILGNDVTDQIVSTPFVPSQARAFASANKEWLASQGMAERERHDAAMEKIGQNRVSITLANQGNATFTPEESDLMGALAERGVSLPAGLRSRQQQKALYAGIIARHPGQNADEIADLIKKGQIEFGAQKKETQTAAGVAGRVEVAQNEINEFIPLVKEASEKVPRSSFVPLNKLVQMADTSISDPNLKDLKIYINSLLNAYDMLAARGGTDIEKRREVRELLLSADGPQALNHAVAAFGKEAEAAHRAAVNATRVPELPDTKPAKQTAGAIVSPKSKADYDALPAGAHYRKPGDPEGTYRVKS